MRNWNDDPFTKKARDEDYLARSVYKLQEIDQREKVLKGAKLVIDLGAAPGSWTEYCLERLPQARIIAVDLSMLKVSDPRVTAIQDTIENVDFEKLLEGKKADLVLSDMAPKTSGVHDSDVEASVDLATLALEVAKKHLKPSGCFVVKLFMGGSFDDYNKAVKAAFQNVRLLRPESTRKASREIYFVAKALKQPKS